MGKKHAKRVLILSLILGLGVYIIYDTRTSNTAKLNNIRRTDIINTKGRIGILHIDTRGKWLERYNRNQKIEIDSVVKTEHLKDVATRDPVGAPYLFEIQEDTLLFYVKGEKACIDWQKLRNLSNFED